MRIVYFLCGSDCDSFLNTNSAKLDISNSGELNQHLVHRIKARVSPNLPHTSQPQLMDMQEKRREREEDKRRGWGW